jgi:hypothetical protein
LPDERLVALRYQGDVNVTEGAIATGFSFGLPERFIAGEFAGGEFPLAADGDVGIGREPRLDIALGDGGVSRSLCKVLARRGELEVLDMNSTKGTFVKGQRGPGQIAQRGSDPHRTDAD